MKSITSQVNKVKIEYEKVLSSAKGSGDYTKQFSSRIGDVLKANQKNAISFKIGMDLAKTSAKLAEDKVEIDKKAAQNADIFISGKQKEIDLSKIDAGFRQELSDLAKEASMNGLENIKNQSRFGQESFKQIDLEKQKEKLEQLRNARLAAGVKLSSDAGKFVDEEINKIESGIRVQERRNAINEEYNNKAKELNQTLVSGLDSFISKIDSLPGGKFFRSQLGLSDNDLDKVKKGFGEGVSTLTQGLESGKGLMPSLKDGIGTFKKAVPNVGKLLKVGGPLIAFTALVSIATKFGAKLNAIADQFGSLKVLGEDFQNTVLGSEASAVRLGFEVNDLASVTATLATNFGVSLDEAAGLSAKVLDTAKATGLSVDESANLFGILMQTSNLSAKQAESLAESTFQLARANGVAPNAVLKDIAGSSEVIATFTKDGGNNIAEAAVQARKLGTSIQTTAKIAEGLLDFENSITKEVEASVLIGRQLNFQKARELALNNDIEGAMSNVISQLGSEAEFNKLNAIQRKALADSINVSTAELSKFVGKQKESSMIKPANFRDLVGEESLASITKIVNELKAFGADLVNALGPTVEVIMRLVNVLMRILRPIFDLLNFFIKPLADVVGFLGTGLDAGLSAIGLAQGGIVPTPRGRHPLARGTDTVPAMLTPGELVIPKNQVRYMAQGNVTVGMTKEDMKDVMSSVTIPISGEFNNFGDAVSFSSERPLGSVSQVGVKPI